MTGRQLARFAAMFGLLAGCGGGGGSSKPLTEIGVLRAEGGRGMPGDRRLRDGSRRPARRSGWRTARTFASAAKASGTSAFSSRRTSALHQQHHERLRQDHADHAHRSSPTSTTPAITSSRATPEKTDSLHGQVRLRRQDHICDKGLCATQGDQEQRRACGNPGDDLRRRASYCTMNGRHVYRARPSWRSGDDLRRDHGALPRGPALLGGNLHRSRRARPALARPTTTA